MARIIFNSNKKTEPKLPRYQLIKSTIPIEFHIDVDGEFHIDNANGSSVHFSRRGNVMREANEAKQVWEYVMVVDTKKVKSTSPYDKFNSLPQDSQAVKDGVKY